MAHIKIHEHDEEYSYAFYAILNPLKPEVFVWKCVQHNLRKMYSKHMNLKIERTKAMVAEAKKAGQLPHLYILEVLDATRREAYDTCVSWAKYFKENGYKVIPMRNIEEYADQPTEVQQEHYDEVKRWSISEVIDPSRNPFPNYGDKSKADRETREERGRRITLRVLPEDYEAIKGAAEKRNLTVADYSRDRVLNGQTIIINRETFSEYLDELAEDNAQLKQILYQITERGDYLPSDMENIQRLSDDILKTSKGFQRAFVDKIKELKKTDLR